MKAEKKILVAFLLNLFFSVFEFVGGAFTGSVAIISDALHDMGDAVSIGLSFYFERKSRKKPDGIYTYGYRRYSLLGSLITTVVLTVGSVAVILNSVGRIINPVEINYDGMIVFALVGTGVNLAAAIFTGHGESLNQRAVNLHMLEDMLGWVVVLAGAVIMKFTDLKLIDPLMSVGVSVFILINAVSALEKTLGLFLEKAPDGFSVGEIQEKIIKIEGVEGVHHIHLWSMDGISTYATMHIVTHKDTALIKKEIRHMLSHMGINHCVIETERSDEICESRECTVSDCLNEHHHHHHHHHH